MGSGGGALRERLAGLADVGDDALALAATALAIAGLERPDTCCDHYDRHLDELAEGLAATGAGGAEDRARALAAVMGERHRYVGDEHDDDESAGTSLMWVIDNRRGAAEALGILGLEAARRAGWQVEGLAFAPRFLLRLEDGSGRRVIVDPALGWRPLEAPDMRALLKATSGLAAELAPEHYQRLPNRDILVRLQTQAKLRRLRQGSVGGALAAVEIMLLFAPDRTLLWREAGLMHMRLGQLPRAVAALEQFLARTPNPLARRRTAQLLQELKDRMR